MWLKGLRLPLSGQGSGVSASSLQRAAHPIDNSHRNPTQTGQEALPIPREPSQEGKAVRDPGGCKICQQEEKISKKRVTAGRAVQSGAGKEKRRRCLGNPLLEKQGKNHKFQIKKRIHDNNNDDSHCVKCFTYLNLFDSQDNPMSQLLL